MLALMGILAILLVKLAVLQYDWVGQNAEHERQTMQTALHNLAIDFAEKFNREIHRTYSYAEMNGEALAHREYHELVERYTRWRATASYPGLIKNVFLAVSEDNEKLTLLRLNEVEGRFEKTEWTSNLADLRDRFDPRAFRSKNEAANQLGRLVEHGYIAGGIPAVVRVFAGLDPAAAAAYRSRRTEISRERSPERSGSNLEKLAKEGRLRELGLAIIELDRNYIKQVFIPDLAKASFYRGLDFELTVVDRSDPYSGIIYTTGPVPALEAHQSNSSLSSDEEIGILASAIEGNTASEGANWRVLLKHRAGSVEMAVARLRIRNLAVSFGILFLLAASVVIIIITSRRSQQLARKQMDFVAGVSHEFRTPLAVIHAISENLADGLITEKAEIEKCGMVIRDDVRRLAAMVEEVLQLAGAFRGKALYHRSPVDLAALIDQVLARYPQLGQGGDWQLEKRIEAGLPQVLADSTALRSALGNILDNAIKYSGNKRWISIKALTQTAPSPAVVMIIEDKGRGITVEDMPHIFEPFYRGQEVRAAQIHGNGLGLSLVKNIVDAHGGTIRVESVAGTGTTFTVTLPAVTADAREAAGQAGCEDERSPATAN
jgi:signal transduction histidine kinase